MIEITVDIGTRNLQVAVALTKLIGQFHDGSYAMAYEANMGNNVYATDFFYRIAQLDGLMPILVMERYLKDIKDMYEQAEEKAQMPKNSEEFLRLVENFHTSYAPEHDQFGLQICEFKFVF